MQMTTDARAWLDEAVRRILARHPLGDAERAGVTYELMSHLHGMAEARAIEQGRTQVTKEDLELAVAEAGGDAKLAEAFVQPLAKPVERVLFWRRAAAAAIDFFLLGIALSFVHGAVTVLLVPAFGTPGKPFDAHEFQLFMPWGFHDATLPIHIQALIAVASAVTVMGYFTWFEGHEGRSLGKRALDLRVIRIDGQPMTYRAALLRNLVKLVPLVLLLDTLLMLIAFQKDKQRVSDKVAETIVVRT